MFYLQAVILKYQQLIRGFVVEVMMKLCKMPSLCPKIDTDTDTDTYCWINQNNM